MPLRPGQAASSQFTTASPTTGAAANADLTPTALLTRNGTDDGAVSFAVSNPAAGRYIAAWTVPSSYTAGDIVDVVATATVGGITGKAVVASYVIDPQTPAGSRVVNQDFGSVGALTVKNNAGQALAGVIVTAYIAAAYLANPATAQAQGQTTTDVNGAWTLYLNPAAYTLAFNGQPDGDSSTTTNITVT